MVTQTYTYTRVNWCNQVVLTMELVFGNSHQSQCCCVPSISIQYFSALKGCLHPQNNLLGLTVGVVDIHYLFQLTCKLVSRCQYDHILLQ